ncbi:MAG: ABC transporter ATP-binding protein, partial [Polyangiaceae bacterium]
MSETKSTRGFEWLRRLAPHVGSYRRELALCVLLSVIGQIPVGLLPLVQKVIIDDVVIDQRRALWPWLTLLLGLGGVGFWLQYVRRYRGAKVSLALQHGLRVALYRHLQRLDFARHEQLSPGDVMSRAAGDVTLIQMFLYQVPLLAANMTLLVIALGVMFVLSPMLSLVVLAFVPLFVLLAVRFRDRIFPASWNDQQLTGAVAGVVEEAVSGVQVVKAFGQEERELSLLIQRARDLFRSRLRTAKLTARSAATLQALPALAQLGVLVVGGILVLREHLTLGVFLAFSSYLIQLVAPVRLLSGMLASSQQARAGAERVLELLELSPNIRDHEQAETLDVREGRLELEGVTFAYG